MHVFAKINYAIVAVEQREERERLLLLAHQEAKAAKLELKRKLRDQLQLDVSNKVRRALTYFEFVCDSTSNPRQPHVAEERLGKLWQFMQMMEEWKILKGGRLIEAERTKVTLTLLQQLQETTVTAFGQMMDGGKRPRTDKGGGTLPYPVLCLERSGDTTRKLVLRLGTRMGITQQDNSDYGMILDLDQNFDTLEKDESRTLKQGYAKSVVVNEEDDLLKTPFFRIQWPLIVKAYKVALRRVAFLIAMLDEFNSLAKVLQNPDAVLSKVQLAKWQADVETFLSTLHEHSALAHATQRILTKKGLSVLKRRAQARRKQLRERENEMQRLRELQLEREQPKLTFAQQLKVAFLAERAPRLREAVELTPAEKMGAKAGELLGKAASSVVTAARNVKKEYVVRTL
ncbi:hypothetical protein BBO99_00004720 [Phytophthora kernoviae]|uniref:Uncharacterized protein n=2 Tax=Phytophthora kernoviae TaxID=325452 RepID=A0A3R7G5C7_9STRA|nr:hypothetical protein G195_008019 [Phytophthora kernoviae 00238/432]KAG2520310.1 hypothetical protein JM16_006765 [Phytophthora kernoviae]KAG2521247.1 hypothetical protein JM18_006673 [Phytophthora kernoviae]RLN37025.1 hypothetical protein BBI17_004924 [Phytophthora kernoviae]RLN80165.1 hypothetical protein BBO99_00004720 [Phytophthora kernoviae]